EDVPGSIGHRRHLRGPEIELEPAQRAREVVEEPWPIPRHDLDQRARRRRGVVERDPRREDGRRASPQPAIAIGRLPSPDEILDHDLFRIEPCELLAHALDALLDRDVHAIGHLYEEHVESDAVASREDARAEDVEALREEKTSVVGEETRTIEAAERDLVVVAEGLVAHLRATRALKLAHERDVARHALGKNLSRVGGMIDQTAVIANLLL